MKAILFDPFSGASGDMIIGGLIDLGADEVRVKESMEMAAHVNAEFLRIVKKGISACSVKVTSKKEGNLNFQKVIERVNSLQLPAEVKSDALAIFTILGNAEAKVHGVALVDLHFHELGQEDAIADIIGACTAFHDLGLKRSLIFSMPISTGTGFVEFAHGTYPVPAPATLEIAKDYALPCQFGHTQAELLTPTGAAILAHFVNEAGPPPAMKTERIGYGAGRADLGAPNVLRIISGTVDEALVSDRIEMLETNVDDVTGQVLGNLIDELLEAGANDVAIIPAAMKKGRSGHIIQVIGKPEDSERLARKIIEQTGSLGVRVVPVKHRFIVPREMGKVDLTINTRVYSISVKIAKDVRGNLLNASAEFDECRDVARESGIPVRDVIRLTEEKARRMYS